MEVDNSTAIIFQMMRHRLTHCAIALFFFSSVGTTAYAAGFDCHKASSPLEKLICSDQELSTLDGQLSQKFAEAKTAHPDDADFLLKDQRHWLQSRIQECSPNAKDEMPQNAARPDYINCLKSLYTQRIKLMDFPELWPPLTDAKAEAAIAHLRTLTPEDVNALTTSENRNILAQISCRFFEKDPKAAAKLFGAYFGSSKDGWTPLCSNIDITDKVPAVKQWIDALQPAVGAATACDGSIQFFYRRDEMILRILAATDPAPDIAGQTKEFQTGWERLGYHPDLHHWSQQGNWEKRQYKLVEEALTAAKEGLRKYYIDKFHVSDARASELDDYYSQELMKIYVGRSGASSTLRYPSLCFETTDLDHYMQSGQLPEKNCPYQEYADISKGAELRRLLGLAIVNDYPLSTIQKLIDDGAELNPVFKNHRDKTDSVLMMAAGRPEVTELLLKKGAKPNYGNSFGKTALMYAIGENNARSVKLLLAAGADVNAKTSADIQCTALKAGNRTPLMYAAWQSGTDIIRMLLDAKADRTAKDTEGHTAAAYLSRNTILSESERQEIGTLLQ